MTGNRCRFKKGRTCRPTNATDTHANQLLVLVLHGRGSSSAVDAHIFPHVVQSVLENIYCGGIYNFSCQTIPLVDYYIAEKLLPYCDSRVGNTTFCLPKNSWTS